MTVSLLILLSLLGIALIGVMLLRFVVVGGAWRTVLWVAVALLAVGAVQFLSSADRPR